MLLLLPRMKILIKWQLKADIFMHEPDLEVYEFECRDIGSLANTKDVKFSTLYNEPKS